VSPARSLDNGVGRTPPLGWNTWCVDGQCARDYCTAAEVKETADIIVSKGLRELGWTHINLDDCWGWNRSTSGEYQADPTRFPPAADARHEGDGRLPASARFKVRAVYQRW
jgi:alpha-galactosidase